MKNYHFFNAFLTTVLLLAFLAGLTSAQDLQPQSEPQAVMSLSATVSSRISYQGVLQENGQRVNEMRNMVFHLFTNAQCTGSPLQSITKNSIQVVDGLFDTDLDITPSNFNGQALWLRVAVAGVNLGCEEILPVPYALSLRPEANIIGNAASSALIVRNTTASGRAHGVYARTDSAAGAGIYAVGAGEGDADLILGGTSDSDDNGVMRSDPAYTGSDLVLQSNDSINLYLDDNNDQGSSLSLFNGADQNILAVTEGGTISSAADSYIFVPGGDAVLHGATTGANLRYWGAGDVSLHAETGGSKEIVFPLTLPGILFGQATRIEEISFTYKSSSTSSEFGAWITQVWIYRKHTDGSERTILRDTNSGNGWSNINWTPLNFGLSTNNTLSAADGQVAVRITCNILTPGERINFTGIRVRLGHN